MLLSLLRENSLRIQDIQKTLIVGLLFAASILAQAAKPLPAPPSSYLYNEGVISEPSARSISQVLRAVEERTGHQFTAGLFQSLEDESLEDYTNKLFKAWKIGDAKRNDGLLFCLFLKERRWRVEIGYGLEGTIPDLEAADIVRASGVPYFKASDFNTGVQNATEALAAKLAGAQSVRLIHHRARETFSLINGIFYLLLFFYFIFWLTYERGFHWSFDSGIGRRAGLEPRYPLRFFFILWLYFLFLLKLISDLLMSSGRYSGGYGGGSDWGSGGGFSGGGGSSGGGGASGGW